MAEFPDDVMRQTAQWVTWFASSWRQDVPLKIHSGAIAEDGTREWHPDFTKWMSDDHINQRTKRAFKRLRRSAVREYEVCYRIIALGDRIDSTTEWLNERAARNDIPYPKHRPDGPHYSRKDTLALLIAGLSYAKQYW